MTPCRAALLACLLAVSGVALAGGVELDCEGAAVEIAALFPEGPQFVYGYPALFGPPLNETATPPLALAEAAPINACGSVAPPVQPGGAALVTRGNCSFLDKALAVQQAGFAYMVLFNTEPGCVFMSGTLNASTREVGITAVSVTGDAGRLLQQLAAAGGSVTLRAPYLPRVDVLSAAALWLMAVGTVVAGSLWSAAELRHQLAGTSALPAGQVAAAKDGQASEAEVTVISAKGALMFIVVASAMLLLMFFFLNSWFALVLVVLFALGAWQTLAYVLLLALLLLSPRACAAATVSLPRLGPTSAVSLLANSTAAVVAVTWFVARHTHWAWVLQDLLGISLMLVVLQQLRLPNLKVASILLPSAFLYDIWWVFLQPLVTGGDSVMIAVASGGKTEQLPMLLEVPRRALGSNTAYSMLGFGDVIMPGLLAVFAGRFDTAQGLSLAGGYFLPCSIGYGAGLVLTYLALIFSIGGSQGQPALLYLVPCTLGTVAFLGWVRGQFWDLWRFGAEGAAQRQQQPDVAERMEAGLDNERRSLLASNPQSPSV